jgi:hypothetical protein
MVGIPNVEHDENKSMTAQTLHLETRENLNFEAS